jgi:hypothetical protein
MTFKILSGGPKTNKFQFMAARHWLLFDLDLRHSGRQEGPDRNRQYAAHAGIPSNGRHPHPLLGRRRDGPIGDAGVGDSLGSFRALVTAAEFVRQLTNLK